MITSLLRNKRVWAFVGGLVTAKVLKSDTVHDFAVKTMAERMKIQKIK